MLETRKGTAGAGGQLPKWVPQEAKRYLAHTESGDTIRELARRGGCAPSTVLRQVRKLEQKRDDPLIDEALSSLSRLAPKAAPGVDPSLHAHPHFQTSPDIQDSKDKDSMTDHSPFSEPTGTTPPDDATIAREARRILRRLSEPGACLAVAKDMEKAVVVRDLPDGRTARTAVLDRPIAQAMALKDWIVANAKGKITRYTITAAGRAALRGFLAEDESARAGFAEAPTRFDAGSGGFVFRDETQAEDRPKRIRYNAAESPVMVLARRRDKDGAMFLLPELVAAAERLREDFELAQMGAGGVNWERFLIEARQVTGDVNGFGSEAAKARVAAALGDLGPGLGDVALRCCCFLEGMEQAEKRMGWSARSGKIVLRIALQRLKKHYDEAGYSNLIG
ncbi:helix-turn-helix domain containing protein [Celeribacter ethanolicus]|uniref:Helix-turn-helix domain containing protein n=1 Tax=Celeribacter ethanolicus TaxID=1758178 RepID=A0A291GA16_9RHOB|nr:DUF6456 domain-containing protein [Celeribacter ethanolicus]ATG47007.1 helix-turn-helix domain containing protein [Celeribacter ethanolicus]